MPSLTVETEALCVRLDVVVVGEGGLTGTEEPARGWSTSSIEPSKDSLLPCSRSTSNDDDREVSGEGEWKSFGDGRSTGRGAGGLVTGVTEMVGKGVCVLLELELLAICIEAAVGVETSDVSIPLGSFMTGIGTSAESLMIGEATSRTLILCFAMSLI